MRIKMNYFSAYLMLVVAQVLICNYFHLSAFVMLSILPVMVLCIPIRYSTPVALCIAFATGWVVDVFAEGVWGLNILALVPVAFVRRTVIQAIFGEDLFARKEDFSVRRNGFGKVSLAVVVVQSIFLLIYIAADGAGTRPFWFNLLRFICSLAAGYLMSMLIADTLAPESRK